DPGMLVLSPENLSVFKTGLVIAGATMRLELGGAVAEDRAKRDLQFLFCQAMLVEEAVRLLKKLKREQIYPGSTDQEDTCGAAALLLTDLMRFETWPAGFQNDTRLLRAADQIALALSAWSKVLTATVSASERDYLDQLLSVMSQHAKSTVEVRVGAIAHLVTYLSPAVDPYFGDDDHAEPDDPEWIRGGLSFWKWASGLRRLYEIWIGHRLA